MTLNKKIVFLSKRLPRELFFIFFLLPLIILMSIGILSPFLSFSNSYEVQFTQETELVRIIIFSMLGFSSFFLTFRINLDRLFSRKTIMMLIIIASLVLISDLVLSLIGFFPFNHVHRFFANNPTFAALLTAYVIVIYFSYILPDLTASNGQIRYPPFVLAGFLVLLAGLSFNFIFSLAFLLFSSFLIFIADKRGYLSRMIFSAYILIGIFLLLISPSMASWAMSVINPWKSTENISPWSAFAIGWLAGEPMHKYLSLNDNSILFGLPYHGEVMLFLNAKMGLIGPAIIIGFSLIFCLIGLKIAISAVRTEYSLMTVGLVFLLIYPVLMMICSALGLLPVVKGEMPLFIGSDASTVLNFSALGLIFNVFKNRSNLNALI